MPAVAITNVMPIASTPTTLPWRSTLKMLSFDMKDSPLRIAADDRAAATTTPKSAYSW